MSFSDYLNNRKSAFDSMTQSLKTEINQESRGSNNVDDRIWKPQMGADNTGYAVVRFLPGQDFNKTPWIRMYSHGFQGPTGKWYIENSLTTLGQKDPVGELNSSLWNNGTEAGKDQARKQKRRTAYFANVLVIKDPVNPANDGKVKIYQFGQRIFDKIMGAMQPEFQDDTPMNPFDLIEGANFRIKIKMVGGYWNYDSSDFERVSPLSENDEKLEAVFNAQYDIHEMLDESKFKSYDELQTKLNTVMNVAEAAPVTTAQATQKEVEQFVQKTAETSTTVSSDDDEDLEDFFKNLSS